MALRSKDVRSSYAAEKKRVGNRRPRPRWGSKRSSRRLLLLEFCPKEIDFKMDRKGKEFTEHGIYKPDGDTLTVWPAWGGKDDRPKELKGGDGAMLTVYNRAAKR